MAQKHNQQPMTSDVSSHKKDEGGKKESVCLMKNFETAKQANVKKRYSFRYRFCQHLAVYGKGNRCPLYTEMWHIH